MHKNSLGLSDALYGYMLENSLREPEILGKLRAETATRHQARMQISPEQGQFMALLVQLMGAKRALEIGVFTGYSSTCVALALPADGEMIACDVSAEYTEIARRYWQAAGVAHKIELRLGPALQTLDHLLAQGQAETFDFAFIDADKGNYPHYYDRALQLLRPGGLMAIDNVLWSGRVADPAAQDKITRTIRVFNQKVAEDDRVTLSLLPIADGLTLALKIPS
jgi:predicted O-methyltransferase YrrM